MNDSVQYPTAVWQTAVTREFTALLRVWCMGHGASGLGMVHGAWSLVHGAWSLVPGAGGLVQGAWCMGHIQHLKGKLN